MDDLNHPHNIYDGHVTAEAREQIEDLTSTKPTIMVGDHGYRGTNMVTALAEDGTYVGQRGQASAGINRTKGADERAVR